MGFQNFVVGNKIPLPPKKNTTPIVLLMILTFFRQCKYSCTNENSLRDGDTSQSTCNPL